MPEFEVGDWVTARRPLRNPNESEFMLFYDKIGYTPFRITDIYKGVETSWAFVEFPVEIAIDGRVRATVYLENLKRVDEIVDEAMYAEMKDYG